MNLNQILWRRWLPSMRKVLPTNQSSSPAQSKRSPPLRKQERPMTNRSVETDRLDQFQDDLNARLTLKDRWISDRFTDFEKRSDVEVHHLYRHVEVLTDAHKDTHLAEKSNVAEFKIDTQQRLDALEKRIDVLREERGLFVLRDSYETQLDAIEKTVDALERTFVERLEVATKQIKDTFDTRVQANTDRLTKMEQNLQVMNARNQQSIIALGILLTLVEIIIRFYQS
jgi:hypothetical protein